MPERFYFSQLVGSEPGRPSCSQSHQQACGPAAGPSASAPPAKCYSWRHPSPQDRWSLASAAGCNGPQRGGDKMQGPGNLLSVRAGRGDGGGSEESAKKCVSRAYCDLPRCVWGREVAVLVAFINPADGKVSEFFKASRMLACNENT